MAANSTQTALPEAPSASGGEDEVSIPLYLAGLVVVLCGLQAINVLHTDEGWKTTTLLLAVMGFAFSYGCRWLRIRIRAVEIVWVAIIAYALAEGLNRQGVFLPNGSLDLQQRVTVMVGLIGVLLSWVLVSDSWILFLCVPSLAMLGAAGSASGDDPTVGFYFCIFVPAAIFLVIHHSYLQSRALASPQEQARETGWLLPTQAAFAAVSALAVLGLALLFVVPVQAIFGQMSSASVLRKLVGAGGKPASPDSRASQIRFSDDSNLDVGTGSGWSASSEVVMHVAVTDNQEHYWRGRTYDLYDGRGWKSTLQENAQALTDNGSALAGSGREYTVLPDLTPGDLPVQGVPAGRYEALFDVKGETNEFYYGGSPRRIALDVASDAPRQGKDGRIDLNQQSLSQHSYHVVSDPTPDPMRPEVAERLRHAGARYPAQIRRLYLNGGMKGDVITSDALQSYRQAMNMALHGLSARGRNPYDKTVAIRDWVAARCVYSLSVAPTPADADHVSDFLFRAKLGYCDLFASSMAVLCRTAGIPARVATGFAPGERDDKGFALRAMDKHAWVEVYFPKYGWLPFDPTVGTRTDGSVNTNAKKKNAGWLDALKANGPLPTVLLITIVLISAYLVKTEIYDRIVAGRRKKIEDPAIREAEARTEVGQQYARLTRSLGRLGLPRRPSETPTEYAARAEAFISSRLDADKDRLSAAPLAAITEWLIAARYSPLGASSAELTPDLAQEVSDFHAAARRAYCRRLWQRRTG